MTYTEARYFITTWCAATCLGDAVSALGIDRRECSNIAAHFRRRGIQLPALPGTTKKQARKPYTAEEMEELRKLAADLARCTAYAVESRERDRLRQAAEVLSTADGANYASAKAAQEEIDKAIGRKAV